MNNENLFRKQALDNHRQRLYGEILLKPKFPHTILVSVLFLWFFLLMLWLLKSEYARKETVLGWLEPPAGVIRIYPIEPGAIKSILVEEGQHVLEGQPLLTMKNEKILRNGNNLQSILAEEYEAQRENILRQLDRVGLLSQQKISDLNKSIEAAIDEVKLLKLQIDSLHQRHSLALSQVASANKLRASGHISQEAYENRLAQQLSIEEEQRNLKRSFITQENLIDKLRSELSILPQESANNRDQLNAHLSILSQQISELNSKGAYTIVSPKTGIVSNLQVVEGQLVDHSDTEPLMSLLPEDATLKAQLLVPVRSVGFIESAQKLNIRYDAFPHQKFGLFSGEVTHVSKTLLLPNEVLNSPVPISEPVYRVTATINNLDIQAYGKTFVLRSGMTLSADIELDERHILEWLFEPLLSVKGTL